MKKKIPCAANELEKATFRQRILAVVDCPKLPECVRHGSQQMAVSYLACAIHARRTAMRERSGLVDLRSAWTSLEGFVHGRVQIDPSCPPAPLFVQSCPGQGVVVCGAEDALCLTLS
jgi:hypothetical protein